MPGDEPADGQGSVLAMLAGIVPALARALGPQTEVVLHDLTKLPDSIVAVAGSVTGRRDGGPASDLLLKQWRNRDFTDLLNYESVSETGSPMRSSSIFLRGSSGEPVGCLCVNVDVSQFALARDLLTSLIAGQDEPAEVPGESFAQDAEDLSEQLLDRAIATVGTPLHLMKRDDRRQVVVELDRSGYFQLRDAVENAAARLNVTRHTIYNYLKSVRVVE